MRVSDPLNGDTGSVDQCKAVTHAVKADRRGTCEAQEEIVDNRVQRYVTRSRISMLLGIPEGELNRISQESGFGRVERAEGEEEVYFSYEELPWICMLAAYRMQAIQ